MKARIAIVTILAMGAALLAPGMGSASQLDFQPRAWRITGLVPGDPTPDFHYPFGIAINDSDDVYVTDTMNDAVLKFANDGTYLSQWGGHGSANGQFDRPTGIAIGSTGDVFVTDTMNNRIQVFGPGGAYLDQWGIAGRNGGEFNHPIGIAISDADKVYVADTFNDRIEKFDPDGTFLTEFGESGSGRGKLNRPVGVAVDPEHVYVTDNGNSRVLKFAKDGTYLDSWDGFNAPTGIAIDGFGNLYVANSYDHEILVLNPENGQWIWWFGQGYAGADLGYYNTPTGVAVDQHANVYVADTNNKRIQVFEPCCALYLRYRWHPVVAHKTFKLRGRLISTVPECKAGSQIDLLVKKQVVDSTLTDANGAFTFSMKITKRTKVRASFSGKPFSAGTCAPTESYPQWIWIRSR